MIRIKKGPAPIVLEHNYDAWTSQYLAYIKKGESPPASIASRYRHPDIKAAVIAETHGKCAYCESRVTHVYPGDVEHIIPKSKKRHLIFHWDNLTYACSVCNGHKGDYHDDAEPLVNPCSVEPTDHLTFFGPLCCHLPGDSMGQLTCMKLDLNRPALFEQRKERMERLIPLIDQFARQPRGPLRDLLKKQIVDECGDDKEYSLMVRRFLEETCRSNARCVDLL